MKKLYAHLNPKIQILNLFSITGLTNKPIEVNASSTITSTLYAIGCSAASWAWVHPIATSIIVIGAAAGAYWLSKNWSNGGPDVPPVTPPDSFPVSEFPPVQPVSFSKSLEEALPEGEYKKFMKQLKDLFEEEDSIDFLIEYLKESATQLEGLNLSDRFLHILLAHYRESRNLSVEEFEEILMSNDELTERIGFLSEYCAKICQLLIDSGFVLSF